MFRNEYDKAKEYFEENLALRKEIGDLDGIAAMSLYLGVVAYRQGKWKSGRALVEQSQGLFSEIHNETYRGFTHMLLGEFDMIECNYVQAAAHYSEALSIGQRQGSAILIHQGLFYLGWLAIIQGNILEATEWFEDELAYFRKKDHKNYIAGSLYSLGLLARITGELKQASRLYEEGLINCRASVDPYVEACLLCELGKVALAQGEINQALAQFEQVFKKSFSFSTPLDDQNPLMFVLEAMAALAVAQGQLGDTAHHSSVAVRLLGATEAWHTRVHNARIPLMLREREDCIATLRAAMSEQAFAAAFAEGQAMTQEQAVVYALEDFS